MARALSRRRLRGEGRPAAAQFGGRLTGLSSGGNGGNKGGPLGLWGERGGKEGDGRRATAGNRCRAVENGTRSIAEPPVRTSIRLCRDRAGRRVGMDGNCTYLPGKIDIVLM